MGPIMDEAAVTAALKSLLNPTRSMASISMVPNPAASAWATPDMPAKMMLATTFTWARLPLTCPNRAMAKSKMR